MEVQAFEFAMKYTESYQKLRNVRKCSAQCLHTFKIAIERLYVLGVVLVLISFVIFLLASEQETCVGIFYFNGAISLTIFYLWAIMCYFSIVFFLYAFYGLLRVVYRLGKSGQNLKINFCSMFIHCLAYYFQFTASCLAIGNVSDDPVVTVVSLTFFDFCV